MNEITNNTPGEPPAPPRRRMPPNAGKGRPKGSKNKTCISRDVKEMVLMALNMVGGVEYLCQQANKNPVAFMHLVAKLLPTRVAGDADNPVRVIHTITRRIIHDSDGGTKQRTDH